jgi:hypothetical protein
MNGLKAPDSARAARRHYLLNELRSLHSEVAHLIEAGPHEGVSLHQMDRDALPFFLVDASRNENRPILFDIKQPAQLDIEGIFFD